MNEGDLNAMHALTAGALCGWIRENPERLSRVSWQCVRFLT